MATPRTNNRATKADRPAPVSLNLDKIEREGEIPEPFAVVLGGRHYTLVDPAELDFRDFRDALFEAAPPTPDGHGGQGDPRRLLELIVPVEDRAAFAANRLPPYRMTPLINGYLEHFGMGSVGESDASSPS